MTPLMEKALGLLRATKFPTSERKNIKRSDHDAAKKQKGMCIGFYFQGKAGIIKHTFTHGELTHALTEIADSEQPGFAFTSIQINASIMCAAHVDAHNKGPSRMLTLGDYTGGQTWVHDEDGTVEYEVEEDVPNSKEYKKGMKLRGRIFETRNRWIHFDGTRLHYTMPFEGERYTMVYFSNSQFYSCPEGLYKELMLLNFAKNSDNPHRLDAIRDVAAVDPEQFYGGSIDGVLDVENPADGAGSANERPRNWGKQPAVAPPADDPPAPAGEDESVDQGLMEQIFMEAERARNVLERDHAIALEGKDEEIEWYALRESDLNMEVGKLKEQVEKVTNENRGLRQAWEDNKKLRAEIANLDAAKAKLALQVSERDREIERLEKLIADYLPLPDGSGNEVSEPGSRGEKRTIGDCEDDGGVKRVRREASNRSTSPCSNAAAWAEEQKSDHEVEHPPPIRRGLPGSEDGGVLSREELRPRDVETAHEEHPDAGPSPTPAKEDEFPEPSEPDHLPEDLDNVLETENEAQIEDLLPEEPSLTPESVC